MALTEIPSELSSTPSIADGGNATAITIDANERVGIGIALPEVTAHLSNAVAAGSDNLAFRIQNPTNAADARVGIGFHVNAVTGSGWDGAYIQSANTGSDSGDLRFGSVTNNTLTESLSISAAGTVTASPSGGAITLGASGHITSKQSLDVATAGGRYIGSSNRGILGQIRIEQIATNTNGGYLDFDTCANGSVSPTRRMRLIDTKLLLGKTSQDLNTSGISINGDGYIQVTEADSPSLYLNRLSSNGSIINFFKDGAGVGSLQSRGDVCSTIVLDPRASSGIGFTGGAKALIPTDHSGGLTNGIADIGLSSYKFKNGYFSGQVFANVIGRSDDTNTTIDFPGSDVIQMFSNGSERMRVVNQGLRIGGGATAYTGAQFEVSAVSSDDRHVRSVSSGSNSSISGSSQRSMMVEGVVAVNTVSAGTQLTIPHFSQNGLWRPMMVELTFVTGEYNRTIGSTGGWAKFGYSVLTQVNGLATMGFGGNVAGVSASGNNIIVTFGAGYTAGLANYEGVCMYYKVMSITPDYFHAWDATLN